MFSNDCFPSHKKWDPKIWLHFCKHSCRSFVIVIHHFHIDHNTPGLLPKLLHNCCFLFPLGRLCYPGEIGNNGYANFFGGWGERGEGGGVQTRVVCHSGKSGWKVNWARLSGSFQRQISGSNGISEKVVLFFRTEFMFHFFKAIFYTSSGFRCRFSANVADLYKW